MQPTVVVETIKTQKSVLDLTTGEYTKVHKDVVKPEPLNTENPVADVLARLGNDAKKLAMILYDGLVSEAVELARASGSDWLDEAGKTFDGEILTGDAEVMFDGFVNTFAVKLGIDNVERKQRSGVREKARKIVLENEALMSLVRTA